jgi:alpha-amylase/alpha-mannosidase (GH57 family)
MPLLIDTAVVRDSWAPEPAPEVPEFSYPGDARIQLESGLSYMRDNGFHPVGCWPPEGSVSAAATAVYARQGVRWLVTDESILERSLDRPLRSGGNADRQLYRPWRLDSDCPNIFFRDRVLSDLIGFELSRRINESEAAAEFSSRLFDIVAGLPEEATITIALDGENPWPHYPACGGVFLRELFARLTDGGPELTLATLAEVSGRSTPAILPRLHPGSWINAVFATWIGHPQKTAAWEILAAVRQTLDHSDRLPESMLLAEGSDWFWWLGDDNPTELAPLYDEIFRRHLADACRQAGVKSPVNLEEPLRGIEPA